MTFRMSHKSSFGGTGNPYNMFLVSLLLHLIFIAAVMISVPGSTRQLTFGPTYNVALVGPEVINTPDNLPALKEMLQPSGSDRPVILKQDSVMSSRAKILKKDESHHDDIEKAIESLRQKSSKTDAPPTAQSKPTVAYPSAAGNASGQVRANDYSRFIWPKIKKNWVLPASLMPKENVTAIIEVRIAQSGALEYAGFEKRSGNRYFDESAMRAVKKSAPFPPLAGWVSGRYVEIGIRFHSAELQ